MITLQSIVAGMDALDTHYNRAFTVRKVPGTGVGLFRFPLGPEGRGWVLNTGWWNILPFCPPAVFVMTECDRGADAS